jgi:hypothetical protein
MTEQPHRLLQSLSSRFKGRISECVAYDANVRACTSTPEESGRLIPVSGAPFFSKLRGLYRGRRLEILSNTDYLRISVKGAFAWGPLTVNAEEKIGFSSKLAGVQVGGHPVYTIDGRVSSVQSSLLRDSVLRHFLTETTLQRGESLHFFNNSIALYLVRPPESRVLAAIDSLVNLANKGEIQEVRLDLTKLPERFHPLVPLVKEWAVDDDSDREQLVSSSSKTGLEVFLKQVEPYIDGINSYVASFGDTPSPEAAALGRLAECALELSSI